jgi:hypothetical protein
MVATANLPNPLPVAPSGRQVTYVDRSGAISAGGTAQVLAVLNTARTGFWIQNQSTGDLWLSSIGTAAASQPSLKIPSGALYEFPSTGVPTAALSIFGALTGQGFAAREF